MLKEISNRNSHFTVINSGLDSHSIRYQDSLIATVSPIGYANSSMALTDQQKEYYAFMIHAYDGPAHGKTFFAANEDEVAEQIEILTSLNASEDLDADAVRTWENKEDPSHVITVLGADRDTRYIFWMNSDSPSALCSTDEVYFSDVFKPIYPEADNANSQDMLSQTQPDPQLDF